MTTPPAPFEPPAADATHVDHLVVAAHSLAQGVQWCEAVLGVTPAGGGRHPLMGTHNRLLALGSAAFPHSYLEILAIDADAPPPGRPRWFGLDDPALQARLRDEGPRLHHVVLRTGNLQRLRGGLVDVGVQPGEPMVAERETPAGLLRWRILVRADGAIATDAEGRAVPTLIQWGDVHPTGTLPASPVALRAVSLGGPPKRAAEVLRPRGVALPPEGPSLQIVLDTPRGAVTLSSEA